MWNHARITYFKTNITISKWTNSWRISCSWKIFFLGRLNKRKCNIVWLFIICKLFQKRYLDWYYFRWRTYFNSTKTICWCYCKNSNSKRSNNWYLWWFHKVWRWTSHSKCTSFIRYCRKSWEGYSVYLCWKKWWC